MAFSENLTTLNHWNFRPSLTDSWNSETFSRETETLTKALQKSLSSTSETITDNQDPYLMNIIKPDPSPTGSGSDLDSSCKRRNPRSKNGKITKRKSRATKRNPTTFITADPSNFRQMVQQVTGIRLGNSHLPVNNVLRPEPQRPGNPRQNSSLPTLDTSNYLMDTINSNYPNHQHLMGPTTSSVAQGSVGLDFGSLQSFPTLESWRLM